MKKSIIAILVAGSFASVSFATQAAESGISNANKCTEGSYETNGKDPTHCTRINMNSDAINRMGEIMFGGSLQQGQFSDNEGNTVKGWFDKDGNMIFDKNGNLVEGADWRDAGYVGQIIHNDDRITNIYELAAKAKITITENADDAAKYLTAKAGDKITNVIEGDTNISKAIDGRIDAKMGNLKDLEPRVERDEKKADGVTTMLFGGKAHLDSNGNFDGILNADGTAIKVGPNGELYGKWDEAGMYGKARSWMSGTDKELVRLEDKKADKTALADLDGKVDGAITDGTAAINEINGKLNKATTVGKNVAAKVGDIAVTIKDNAGDTITNVNNALDAKIAKGAQTQIDNSITNIVNGGNTEINGKWEGAKATANDFDARITANKNRIDDQATRIGKVEDKAETNRKDIVSINKETKRLDNVKADKADLEALDGRVTNNTTAIDNLTNNITNAVDNAKAMGIRVGKVVLNHTGDIKAGADTYIDNRTDAAITANNTFIRNEGNAMYNDLQAQIDASIGEKNEDLTQIRADIAGNTTEIARLDDQKADKADLDKAIADGTDAYNNVNGRIDNIKGNVTSAVVSIGNGIRDNKEEITNVVNGKINNVVDNSITNLVGDKTTNVGIAVEGAKTDLRQLNARMDYAEGDIAEIMVKGNTAKDQLTNDINDVNDRIDNIKSNVRTAAGKIVANKDIIINKGQEAVDKGVTYVNNKISESIINGDNVLANEINNQINAKFEKQGEDFTKRINAEVARGEAAADKGAEELANLNNSLAETNSYVDRQVVRGESAYRVVSTRVDNGYAVGEATRDDLQRQIDELDGKTLNEGDVNTIINNAGKEVAIKVGKGLVDNSTNITEGAKNVINAEINKKVEAGKNLAIQKGKEVVNNVQAKLPAVQGEIVKKAAEAKTYVNNINAKADTALNMGYENAQNITTERNDRIQGQKDTLKAANNYTDNKFSALKNQVESNRRKAASGVAGVAAMTNIPALTGDASGSFGMGLGHYDGAQSISAGVQQRFNQNVIGKASFASDDHGNVVVGVGASVQW